MSYLFLESDVDRVELFLSEFEIFRRRFDCVVVYFFNSDFKFFDDTSEFSVTSFYVDFYFLFTSSHHEKHYKRRISVGTSQLMSLNPNRRRRSRHRISFCA